jgi:thiamine kinase-like enzyme
MLDAGTDATVARVAKRLGRLEGQPVPLESGITNRNVRVRAGGRDYVIRLPGRETELLGIDREAEFQATEAAARIGVGPEVAIFLPDEGILVTRWIEGHTLADQELREPDVLSDVAESLRTVHKGPRLRARFSPFRLVERYHEAALERGVAREDDYERAHAIATEIEGLMSGPDHAPVPCHNDLLPANLVFDGERVRLVDWEYAGMGDRFFDLGSLSVHAGFDEGDDEWLLTSYFGERPTAPRFARVRLMRLMSDFCEAMWGVVESAISPLEHDFDAYADEHFERMRAGAADPSYRRWLEQARAG